MEKITDKAPKTGCPRFSPDDVMDSIIAKKTEIGEWEL
jgi:hypothetical protein